MADIYRGTRDTGLLSYAMDAVLDTGFSLSYRDEVLKFLLPLFPLPSSKDKSPHVHSLTRLLVSLGSPELTIPFLTSFVPGEKLLAYQLAFDLVEGGAQDFLESIRGELPEGNDVRSQGSACPINIANSAPRRRNQSTTRFVQFWQVKSPLSFTWSS